MSQKAFRHLAAGPIARTQEQDAKLQSSRKILARKKSFTTSGDAPRDAASET
jgi:hypothetical protein